MVGGDDEAVDRLTPVFEALAPGVEAADALPAATATPRPRSRAGSTAARTGRATS